MKKVRTTGGYIPEQSAQDGWHFIAKNRYCSYREKPKTAEERENYRAAPGYVYTETSGEIRTFYNGLHAYRNILTAIDYANGPIVCRVRYWGDVDERVEGVVSARHREIVWMGDATEILSKFADWCFYEFEVYPGIRLADFVKTPGKEQRAYPSAQYVAKKCRWMPTYRLVSGYARYAKNALKNPNVISRVNIVTHWAALVAAYMKDAGVHFGSKLFYRADRYDEARNEMSEHLGGIFWCYGGELK